MSSTEAARARTTMAPDAMADYLRDRLGERVVDTSTAYDQLFVTVTPEGWVDAVRLAKEDPALACTYWEYLDAVDRGEEGFEAVVNIYSVEHRHRVAFKTMIPGGREKPVLPTLTALFRGADWSERETYDMFGVEFDGHPGLLPRILTVENFEGWPLRKDFLLSTREAKPWPGSKDPAEAEPVESATGEPQAAESAEDKAAQAKERAERARQKAAEMRAKKAAEQADDQQAGKADPETPEGAADIAQTSIAKDAAAGAVQGDTASGAPGDEPGAEEPVHDPGAEAEAATGAPPAPSGAPGIEEEGRHGGADLQEGERPAAETPGMEAEPAPTTDEPPTGGIPETGRQQVPVKPLTDAADTVVEEDTEATRTTSSEPPPPPSAGSGTDADDRREGSE